MKENKNILIVEDDLSLGFLLMEYLESEGYPVKWCRDGDTGLIAFKRQRFGLCILDIMMPHTDGFSLAHSLKKENADTPFLFLTARTMKSDKLRGYALGAEDYITKPFDEEELLCKIKVILRRTAGLPQKEAPTQFSIGRYFFDYNLHELRLESKCRRLTEKENEVLRLLCLHKNQILRREEAVEKIYGQYDYFYGRSFDVFISRLRKFLSQDPDVVIENVFKVGFILKIVAS